MKWTSHLQGEDIPRLAGRVFYSIKPEHGETRPSLLMPHTSLGKRRGQLRAEVTRAAVPKLLVGKSEAPTTSSIKVNR